MRATKITGTSENIGCAFYEEHEHGQLAGLIQVPIVKKR